MEETSTGHNNYVELVVKTSLRFDPYPFLFREIFFEFVYYDTCFFFFR